MTPLDPSTDPDLIRADGEGMIDRREDDGHPVNTDPPKPAGPQEPTTRAEALAQAKEWGSTLSHWNSYCGSMGDRDKEMQACAQHDLQEQQRLLLLAQTLPGVPHGTEVLGWASENIRAGDAVAIGREGRLVRARLASQDEADSGIEEDTRFNPNALGENEEEYMALARSCSDARLEEHLAEHGLANLPIGQLRSLGARCLIAARRKGGSR